jgi:hypothetical protein
MFSELCFYGWDECEALGLIHFAENLHFLWVQQWKRDTGQDIPLAENAKVKAFGVPGKIQI